MEMSTAYLEETIEWMVSFGYRAARETDEARRGDVLLFERVRWTVSSGESACFVFEALAYPDGRTRWYLAVRNYHGLVSTSYPLDSWKHRPHQVEFKYQLDPESGTALSFILRPEAA